jgi:ATP adenylyltransferase
MRSYLYNTDKINYIKGEKPDVECILCALAENDPAVTSLEITRTERFVTAVNLYPFNAGHLIIFPIKHIISPEEFSREDVLELHDAVIRIKKVLDDEFTPAAYNIGFNIGKCAGASIDHIHLHIVPRYPNEAGFLDVISGTRIMVRDPHEVMNILKARLA